MGIGWSLTHSTSCLLLAGCVAFCAFDAHADVHDGTCGPVSKLEKGPFDYRRPPAYDLGQVEHYHYNSDVEFLRKGESTTNIGEDLEFVLRYFPNHYRALNSMLKLGKRERTNGPRGNRDTIDCWFERARAFVPDDGMVSLLYAIWLESRGDRAKAKKELETARANALLDSPNYVYNLGLAYLEVGDYEHALEFAHRAYALGYTLPGLRDRLQRAGKWRAPSQAPTNVSAAPAAPSAGPAAPPSPQ